jgi:hypothetical protein
MARPRPVRSIRATLNRFLSVVDGCHVLHNSCGDATDAPVRKCPRRFGGPDEGSNQVETSKASFGKGAQKAAVGESRWPPLKAMEF